PVERHAAVERLFGSEDRFGRFSREALADWRSSGLKQHWPALGRARNVERPLDAEEAPVKGGFADVRRIGEAAGGTVDDKRLGRPTIPEPLDDLDELARLRIARFLI